MRAMEILSKYCLKPKPIAFKVLSDEAKALSAGMPALILVPSLLAVISKFPRSVQHQARVA